MSWTFQVISYAMSILSPERGHGSECGSKLVNLLAALRVRVVLPDISMKIDNLAWA